jgi:metal-dependent amidase/aminoacylase/carboxypeptidase family protein
MMAMVIAQCTLAAGHGAAIDASPVRRYSSLSEKKCLSFLYAMPILNRLADLHEQMTTWRRDIHAHPEVGFEENRTAELVAAKLAEFGVEVHRGIGKTGVVGVLRAGSSGRRLGLRADMDALPIREANTFAHRSTHADKMHACGHDGHTTMLLGAAKYLAETRHFDGTVQFIFQPAEEGIGGAKAMIDDGLFRRFPCDAIFGMHNRPSMSLGKFAVRSGPTMAGGAFFDIDIEGRGAHGARANTDYRPIFAPLVNDPEEAEFAAAICSEIVGAENVKRDPALNMASEDFSFMLNEVRGCYINIGNGEGEEACEVHNPFYDFNDAALPYGASFFARLVEKRLAR